ncbi:MAG: RNA polymerase sigma factor [bacterium]|nr:RNA polymerase sigma factor [bacterium]
MEENKEQISRLTADMKKGDEESFRKLFETLKTRIYRYIYRYVGNKFEAEDLTIEAFTRFYENREKVDPQGNVISYIYSISHNLVVDYLRRYKSTVSLDEDIDPGTVLNEEKEDRKVKEVLEILPEKDREYIILKYLEKYSNEEIGEIKNKSVDSVKGILKRARKKLLDILEYNFNN